MFAFVLLIAQCVVGQSAPCASSFDESLFLRVPELKISMALGSFSTSAFEFGPLQNFSFSSVKLGRQQLAVSLSGGEMLGTTNFSFSSHLVSGSASLAASDVSASALVSASNASVALSECSLVSSVRLVAVHGPPMEKWILDFLQLFFQSRMQKMLSNCSSIEMRNVDKLIACIESK
jgi:hypothetical protein